MVHFALAALLAWPVLAWNDHDAITRLALEEVSSLAAEVKAETLADYLAAVGKGSPADFIREHKLSPATAFPFDAGESAGSTITLRTVIAHYSDEPDWAMDQELFASYPELWKDDYQYMGGRTGSHTRIIRHGYWPQGFLKPPVPPRKFPIHDPTPLGEAPERAKLFFDKSREAFQAGRPYWGGRFLAWALHYLEDVTQPFHAVQLPGVSYIQWKPGGQVDIEATTRVVAYYHLCVDVYPGKAASGAIGQAVQDRMRSALRRTEAQEPFEGPAELTIEAAKQAADLAPRTGELAMSFFPRATPEALQSPWERVSSSQFWGEVDSFQKDNPKKAESHATHMESLLEFAGLMARTLVLNATKASEPPPGARLPPTLPTDLIKRLEATRALLIAP